MAWAINEDITKCFNRILYDIILSSVKERISCAIMILLALIFKYLFRL